MSVEKREFGRLPDGTAVELYTLKNGRGMAAEVLSYGCRLARLFVPDRNGKAENVVLGHDTLGEYATGHDVLGAVIGRFANRIAGASFRIGAQSFSLVKNEGENSLHSGPGGFQDRVWRGGAAGEAAVAFCRRSPAGECGFPGNLDAKVTYALTDDNALELTYSARADAETPFNATNHTFFNLTGDARRDILSVEMQIDAEQITEADEFLIPTGKFLPVAGTPFDFRTPKAVGRDIGAAEPSLRRCGGYDHNFVLSGAGFRKAAELYDPASGRRMQVFTDLPGMQVYTANSFGENVRGCGGVPLKAHHAVCLETQFFPDSVHHPEFPYKNLKPGTAFQTRTVFRFSV
ncbi:MAG TPA: galactose-1-epimerase [Ruminococcaceae bacterium]|mgnify:FL=1|nr:galactose-1-epimerase [Oscillospiraceae bacterium]